MKKVCIAFFLILITLVSACAEPLRHNLIFFIADGLRPGLVTPETAPTLARIMAEGVGFSNTHSMFPTFTTPNASAMATGHKLGDTGDFSNTIDAGFQVPGAGESLTPFLESDPILGDVDEHYSGDYLNQDTVMKAAREAGLNTASIGKLGPTLIFDHTERSGERTLIFDDSTGRPAGIPLNKEIKRRLEAAGLPIEAPSRGENAKAGDFQNQGALYSNDIQQAYFANVTTKVILPKFKEDKKPFMLVFWSRDPDGTQHNQGDSLNRLIPGINGPTTLKAIRNADNNLAEILSTLKTLGLEETTNIIVASDHGFSTISKESATSFAADIHEFIEDRKLNNITLIGHSMGCAAIWSFLELFGDKNIRKIVLIDQAPSVVAWPSWSEEEKNICGSLHTPESLFNTLSLLTSSESSHMRESYIRDCLLTKHCPSDIADWVLFENMKFPALYAARLLMEGSIQDWRDIIRQITLPTLIFGGKASIFNPLSQIWISHQIENSTIHIFEESEGGSHFMWLENPKKFLKLLRDFLTKKDI